MKASNQNDSRKPFYAMVFAFIALLLSSTGLYLSLNRSNGPAAFVQHKFGQVIDYPMLQPNVETRINFVVGNTGRVIAKDVIAFGELVILTTPVLDATEESAYLEFKNRKREVHSTDLMPGAVKWSTLRSGKLSEKDIEYIEDGRTRLYLFGYIKFKDANGEFEIEVCDHLTTPPEKFVWGYCKKHNVINEL